MPGLTPEQRSLRARIAAHQSWANTPDPTARTAPARAAALDRFEREIDPDDTLPPTERTRRAEHLRKAHFARLAFKAAQTCRKTTEAHQASAERDTDAAPLTTSREKVSSGVAWRAARQGGHLPGQTRAATSGDRSGRAGARRRRAAAGRP